MDGTHARPLTAYAALCAAAVVVLAQGVQTSSPVADAIAQAGPPVRLLAPPVTMAMTQQVGESLRDLSTTIASSFVPAAATAQEQALRVVGGSAAADSGRRLTTQVAEPVRIEPATRDLAPAADSKQVQQRAGGAHKADRATARDARKADRAAAKDARKAHRGGRHQR